MSDQTEPIPEDLKELYAISHKFSGNNYRRIVMLIERIAKQDTEIERLNKLRTHCENCGADYTATGLEAVCPCKLVAENASLKAQIEVLSRRVSDEEWNPERSGFQWPELGLVRSRQIIAARLIAARAGKEK